MTHLPQLINAIGCAFRVQFGILLLNGWPQIFQWHLIIFGNVNVIVLDPRHHEFGLQLFEQHIVYDAKDNCGIFYAQILTNCS